MKTTEYLKNLSDAELSALVTELENSTFDETSGLRKAVLEIYGSINIMVLQVNQLIYPILKEVHSRWSNKN